MVYESDQCSLPDKDARGDDATQQVCLSLEQVAPLSGQHRHFAEQRLRYCSTGPDRGPALAYLLALWLLRCAAYEVWKVGKGCGNLLAMLTNERRHLLRTFARQLRLADSDVEALEERCKG